MCIRSFLISANPGHYGTAKILNARPKVLSSEKPSIFKRPSAAYHSGKANLSRAVLTFVSQTGEVEFLHELTVQIAAPWREHLLFARINVLLSDSLKLGSLFHLMPAR